ncbi:DUF427 domain-containing protein [soil metagenome]
MPKTRWSGAVLAEAADDAVEIVEVNVYLPPELVEQQYLRPSSTRTIRPWKGTASYEYVLVDGEENRDAARYYPEPLHAARLIEKHVAFWPGVQIER